MTPQLLRQAMIKNPHHNLWNKPLNKWSEEDRKTFYSLEQKTAPNWKAVNSKKVIRVCDGKIYNSISECRRENGLCKVIMDRKLKAGLEYKFHRI